MSGVVQRPEFDLFLLDDRVADGWAPFSISRPCAELRFGRWTLRERLERFAGQSTTGLLTRPWLEAFTEAQAPPVVDLREVDPGRDRAFLNARLVPAAGARFPESSANLWVDGEFVGCRLAGGSETPDRGWIAEPAPIAGLDDVEIEGHVLGRMWDLIAEGTERLAADLAEWAMDAAPSAMPSGVEHIGEGLVSLGPGASIEPGVLLDTRTGPIALDTGVEVRAGARLSGPLYLGPGSRFLGGAGEALSAGPGCRLRGEIEESIVLGFSNKAHDGFLGHAYVGCWVNLGAETTNSDLKNNYGTVRVGPPGAEADTGLLKLGCFIGDHVKTGIGVLLNTGTVLGVGSNVFGSAMPPKWVPPFSWGSGAELSLYRRDAFLHTATVVMERRDIEVNARTRAWLAAVWDEARA
jgi:UDP-N-acetylglucosamine diphosphorylase/glucosamine-1-phosphate N-acetyltransferase